MHEQDVCHDAGPAEAVCHLFLHVRPRRTAEQGKEPGHAHKKQHVEQVGRVVWGQDPQRPAPHEPADSASQREPIRHHGHGKKEAREHQEHGHREVAMQERHVQRSDDRPRRLGACVEREVKQHDGERGKAPHAVQELQAWPTGAESFRGHRDTPRWRISKTASAAAASNAMSGSIASGR